MGSERTVSAVLELDRGRGMTLWIGECRRGGSDLEIDFIQSGEHSSRMKYILRQERINFGEVVQIIKTIYSSHSYSTQFSHLYHYQKTHI